MEKKICSKCKIEKDLCDFNKNKNYSYGVSNQCKECRKIVTKRYRENNRIKLKISSSEFRKNNPDKVKKSKKKYYLENYEVIKEKNKKYREDNKEKWLKYLKINSEKISNKNREWRKNNIIKRRNYEREYDKKNYNTNILYKLSKNIRRRVREFMKTKKICKNINTYTIIGCTPEELKIHLEKQFQIGMSWENQGFYGWHIDHIIPLSSAKTEEEIYKLCHYTNLQPLWWWDNLKKRDKIPPLPDNTFHIV
jgi:hypothetical protein